MQQPDGQRRTEVLLEGKNAVIYGAGGAIGGAVARTFAREGSKVFLAGRTLAKVEAVAGEISAAGGTAEAARVDALDEQAIEEHADTVAEEAGSIDVSFNAVSFRDVQLIPLAGMPREDFVSLSVTGATTRFLTVRAAPRMAEKRSSVILTLSASAAARTSRASTWEANAERRRLPMVRIDKKYVFEGPDGKASLLDLFEGRRQLIVGHFMFDPSWDDGCPSCSAGADEISNGLLKHLHVRGTTFVYVSRAPLAKIEAYKASKGWTFPWYSSYDSDFNFDFHATLDESVTPVEYNYRTKAEHEQAGRSHYVEGEQPIEEPGRSCFLREGDSVFHTYSV